jgi:hypothetical protein
LSGIRYRFLAFGQLCVLNQAGTETMTHFMPHLVREIGAVAAYSEERFEGIMV